MNAPRSTQLHSDTQLNSASAAPEECFFHRWCEKICCFYHDTLMKLSAPPPTPPPLLCISISDTALSVPLLPSVPTHLQPSCHRPLLLASFSVSLSTDAEATLPQPLLPPVPLTSKLAFPNLYALPSLQELFSASFFSLLL